MDSNHKVTVTGDDGETVEIQSRDDASPPKGVP
jgi:hypothetical protein